MGANPYLENFMQTKLELDSNQRALEAATADMLYGQGTGIIRITGEGIERIDPAEFYIPRDAK